MTRKVRQQNKKLHLQTLIAVVCAVVALSTGVGVKIVRAEWLEPNYAPPQESIPAPITTGEENQSKKGYLELDPAYTPVDNNSLNFDPAKPLVVRGAGAKLATTNVYTETLNVGSGLLYANSIFNWVGIGTTSAPASQYRLRVDGGKVQVGSVDSPASGQAVSAYGSGTGVYADAGANGLAGIYGERTVSGGLAVKGQSQNNIGVWGTSVSGYGVYGLTADDIYAGVYGRNTANGWAGYFNGRLGAGSDVVANAFLPTQPQSSLLSYTAGEEIACPALSEPLPSADGIVATAFDGSNIWVAAQNQTASGNDLFKIRAADGRQLLSINTLLNDDLEQPTSIVFDGQNIWVADQRGYLTKRNTWDGARVGSRIDISNGDRSGVVYSLVVSSEGGQAYIWATVDVAGGGMDTLVKINAVTGTIVQTIELGAGWFPVSTVYDGRYVWVQAADKKLDRILAVSPYTRTSYGAYINGDSHFTDSLAFDGEYLWSVSYDSTQVIDRIWAQDPADTGQHPALHINLVTVLGGSPHAKGIAFDGTYIWAALTQWNGQLLRFPASVNALSDVQSTYKIFTTSLHLPTFLTFDGTYLWLTSYSGTAVANPPYVKIFSGTGIGHTDLNSTVNLDAPSAQAGNFNIGGTAAIGQNLLVSGDLVVPNNQWAGTDQAVSTATGGTISAQCPAGTYMKGITTGSDSKLSSAGGSILCRGL